MVVRESKREFDEVAVISSEARNLMPGAKISQSPPLTFVRRRLLRNDKGWTCADASMGGGASKR